MFTNLSENIYCEKEIKTLNWKILKKYEPFCMDNRSVQSKGQNIPRMNTYGKEKRVRERDRRREDKSKNSFNCKFIIIQIKLKLSEDMYWKDISGMEYQVSC